MVLLPPLRIDPLLPMPPYGAAKRRSVLNKQSNFIQKHGKRHHAFDKEKAPYPQSYDRQFMDLDMIDHVFLTRLRKSITFIDFSNDDLPTSSLDLGCGSGTWVLDAAKEWPDCRFVGFDLVNIQPPLRLLDPSLESRISWVHGNFLTTKLPFDDDEFDHIHIRGIARAVPENKWHYLFEEISRVLRPGGAIEMIEEDISCPTLPRWYTKALKACNPKLPSVHLPDGAARNEPLSPPPTPPQTPSSHDHALLESLFMSVFETRFINMEPTSILPSYFATYFRQVLCSPVVNFPMPPLPPVPTYKLASSRRFNISNITPSNMHRRTHSQSSTSSSNSSSGMSSDSDAAVQQHTPPSSASEDESECTSIHESTLEKVKPAVQPYFSSPSDDTSIGHASSMALIPMSSLEEASSFSLAMHLHRMYNLVLACQESMWEVLNDRIRNREDDLKRMGWLDDDIEGEHSRERFESLLENYKRDMQARTALWSPLAATPSWKLPKSGLLSKAEKNDEDRLYQAMVDAQGQASDSDAISPCRRLRVFLGRKAVME